MKTGLNVLINLNDGYLIDVKNATLRTLDTVRHYSNGHTSRLRRLIRYGSWPLVPNFPTELTSIRRSICCARQFRRPKREPAGSNGAH